MIHKFGQVCWESYPSTWRFPEMGVRGLKHPFFHGMFHEINKPFWESSVYGNPQIQWIQCSLFSSATSCARKVPLRSLLWRPISDPISARDFSRIPTCGVQFRYGGVPLMGVSEGKIPLEWMIWGYPHLWKPPYVFSIWIDLICRFQSNQVEIKVGASCVRPARSEHFRESWWMLTLSDGQLTFPSQELSGPGSTKVIIRTKMQALHTSPTP